MRGGKKRMRVGIKLIPKAGNRMMLLSEKKGLLEKDPSV
jgi:hypothetical protein